MTITKHPKLSTHIKLEENRAQQNLQTAFQTTTRRSDQKSEGKKKRNKLMRWQEWKVSLGVTYYT